MLLPENEHEQTQKWFMDVSDKAENAIVEAHAYLERRDEEPPSELSGPRPKSTTPSISSVSARTTEALRRAQIAKLRAKQVEEEANRRRELERIERERREEIERAAIEHERFANEEIERRGTQEAKGLAAQIELEAQLIALEAESSNTEDLKQRLRDFIDDCDK